MLVFFVLFLFHWFQITFGSLLILFPTLVRLFLNIDDANEWEEFWNHRENQRNGFFVEERLHLNKDLNVNEAKERSKRKSIDMKNVSKRQGDSKIWLIFIFDQISSSSVKLYTKQVNRLKKMHKKRKCLNGGNRHLASAEIDHALSESFAKSFSAKQQTFSLKQYSS